MLQAVPDTIAPLIPAATVILIREHEGQLQTLMLRRNRALKAFGGAWVFPGGRVDKLDAEGQGETVRAKAAAIRETMEETGLDISGADMATLSCWIPPVQEKRRFSTRFFIAPAPDAPVIIDEGEIHDYQWVCPKQVIKAAPNPDMIIMPPTYVSLFELSQFSSIGDALAGIAQQDDEVFETRFARTGCGVTALWLAPAYAWLMLASALAKRSPFMTAAVLMVVLLV